jgi:malate dehydrogenase (oxaloacetate-decarboxylating)
MAERPYELVRTGEGPVLRVRAAAAAVDNLREVSATVAVAVAQAAVADGLAEVELDDPIQQVHQAMWQPEYPRIEPV